jgi:hypothetical protein
MNYILILLLLAPLAAACTPDSMAAPQSTESTPTSAAGSSSQLPVKQIEQIIGAQGDAYQLAQEIRSGLDLTRSK